MGRKINLELEERDSLPTIRKLMILSYIRGDDQVLQL